MSSIVFQNQIQTSTSTSTATATMAADSGNNLAAKIDPTRELPIESGDWAPKSSFRGLSAESLELCTEILGSETGCDFAPASNLFSSAPVLSSYSAPIDKGAVIVDEEGNIKKKQIRKFRKGPSHSLPPPAMKCSAQMRRLDVEGRRIIGPPSYKVVDRSEGRVRLSFLPLSAIAKDEEELKGETVAEKEEDNNSEVERMICEERGHGHGNKWKQPAVWLQLLKYLIYKINIWAGN